MTFSSSEYSLINSPDEHYPEEYYETVELHAPHDIVTKPEVYKEAHELWNRLYSKYRNLRNDVSSLQVILRDERRPSEEAMEEFNVKIKTVFSLHDKLERWRNGI